jgi:hypothetical protein
MCCVFKESLDVALKVYVDQLYRQMSSNRITLLIDLLEFSVENSIIQPK